MIPGEKRGDKRLASEKTIYSIPCIIIGYKIEADKDIHLLVKDIETDDTMVMEMVSADCESVKMTSRAGQFREMEKWFAENIGVPGSKYQTLPQKTVVLITGVGYWDSPHNQIGAAPNQREIHPVLSIRLNP